MSFYVVVERQLSPSRPDSLSIFLARDVERAMGGHLSSAPDIDFEHYINPLKTLKKLCRWRTTWRSVVSTERFRNGAGETTRTSDLLITNQLLYQLSYASRGRRIIYGSRSRYGDVRTLEGQDRG